MSEKFEQSTESAVCQQSSTETAVCNQEAPEDLKTKQVEQAEARKSGKTPSSLDLPKIDFCDVKPEMAVCQSGPEVVAVDDKGVEHKFENKPIEKMPPNFDEIPQWRKDQLQQQSTEMLDKYAPTDSYTQERSMDFQKVSDMQKEIANRQDLTETEKCQLYSNIQETMRETPIKVENWNEKPEMVDSWQGEKDPWHAIAGMDDKYHNRLVNMTPEEATKTIKEQEDWKEGDMHSGIDKYKWKAARLALGVNDGDVTASEAQLKCMRAMRDKGTFAAYADEWEKQYVNKDAVNPHPNRGVGTGGASGVM
jgi:hypothetical protein